MNGYPNFRSTVATILFAALGFATASRPPVAIAVVPFPRQLKQSMSPEEFCSDLLAIEKHIAVRWNEYHAKVEEAPPKLSGPHKCSCIDLDTPFPEVFTVDCKTETLSSEDGVTPEWENFDRAFFRKGEDDRYILEKTKWCNTNVNDDSDQYCEETDVCEDGDGLCACLASDCSCEVCPGGEYISVACGLDQLSTCSEEFTGAFMNSFEFPEISADDQSSGAPLVSMAALAAISLAHLLIV